MEDSLEINVDRPGRKYHKLLDLPCGVNPSTTKATYKNGVLDVEIQRKEKKTRKGFKVDIT
jgi:HSP20 family protein